MPDVPIIGEAPVNKTSEQKLAEVIALGAKSHGEVKVNVIVAEGGPYDGEDLTAPPGAAEVVLPGMFGKTGDFRGPVIYRREGTKMVYVGQPDQTEAIAEEEAARAGD